MSQDRCELLCCVWMFHAPRRSKRPSLVVSESAAGWAQALAALIAHGLDGHWG